MSCILKAICCCCYPKEQIDPHRRPNERDPLVRQRRTDSDEEEGTGSLPGTPESAYGVATYQTKEHQASPYRGNARDKV